jgi:hypothetical protein
MLSIHSGDIDALPYPYKLSNFQHYKLLPLSRAIMVILDRLVPDEDYGTEDDGHTLDEDLRTQSVLMVRTGDESFLSRPITFNSIVSQCHPLDRHDIPPKGENDIEVVRVSLKTAIRFITQLQQREDAVSAGLRDLSVVDKPLDLETDEANILNRADEWASFLIRKAEEEGIDKVWEVRQVLDRVKTDLRCGSDYPYYRDGLWPEGKYTT